MTRQARASEELRVEMDLEINLHTGGNSDAKHHTTHNLLYLLKHLPHANTCQAPCMVPGLKIQLATFPGLKEG